jgi:hypothetical protein
MGTYRILFEIIDKSNHLVWQEVEIQVCADDVIDAATKAREIARHNYGQRAEAVKVTYFSPAVQPEAAVKAGEIARHDYGDTVKPTGIITYFRPREPGRAERQVLPGWNLKSHMNRKRYVIDVSKAWHVEWWAAKLGVSVEAVLDAVQQVGAEADAVEEFLLACQTLSGRQPFALTLSSPPPKSSPENAAPSSRPPVA